MAVPSTLSKDYGALLSTTLENYAPRMRDNISRSNKLVAWLTSKGRFRRVNGGERIAVALMHAQNGTADIYDGYGILDTTPQDGITTAFFEWAQLAVSITISRKEERQNSGKARILNLLEAKTMQAEVSIKELLNNCVVSGKITSGASSANGQFSARVGNLDSNANGPLPIPALIDADPTRSVSIGNINGSTYSFWRNQVFESVAGTFQAFKKEMTNMYNRCTKGAGGHPDFIMADQDGWETYWNALEQQERYIIDDKKTVDILGGSDALKHRGAAMVWDEVVPDVATNADLVDSVGTAALSNFHFICSPCMEYIVDAETDFITTPFVRPENQDARTAQILWMGAIGTNNRRKLGVLKGVSRSITE